MQGLAPLGCEGPDSYPAEELSSPEESFSIWFDTHLFHLIFIHQFNDQLDTNT